MPYVCQTAAATPQPALCPPGFYPYKAECYARGGDKADYDGGELNCARNGSRLLALRDRATYQFIR